MQLKKRILISIGALCGLILALLGGMAIPSALKIQDLTARIHEERVRLDSQYALRIFMRDAVTKMPDVTARLKSLSAMAVKEGGELQFITALEGSATANKVTQVISLETANQKEITAWEKEIPLNLTLTGTYPDFLRYLETIERLPYEIVINSIEVYPFRRDGAFNPEGRVEATITASVLWHSSSAPAFAGSDNGL